jgi:acyl-CoA synthetase (NDP forming)
MPDLRALLAPNSVAIVGVSADVKTIRGRLLHVILERGYPGELYLVSRTTKEIHGRRTYGSLSELPGPVDLAILNTPAEAVPELVEECGRRGIKAALVIASNFAEARGPAGTALQEKLRRVAAAHDIALCGPNCEGLLNTFQPFAGSFSPSVENKGVALTPTIDRGVRVGVTAQSGALSFAFLPRAQGRQLAFSYVVSTGNEACLQTSDYVDFMLADGRTDIVLMYVEGIGRPERFLEVAARAADLGKPLIVAKPGRSEAARRAARSHTGSLAGEARATEAVLREYGVVRADDIDSMLDTALAFSYRKLPRGKRVAIISASGGGAVWMAETLAAHGFELPPLDAATRAAVEALLPSYGSAQNPVDVTAQAIRDVGYARIIELVAQSPLIDLIVVVGSLAYEYGIEKDRDALERVVSACAKPVAFCTFTTASPRAIELLASAGIPAFVSMPSCARALSALADYAAFQTRWVRDRGARQPVDGAAPRIAATRARIPLYVTALCEAEAKTVLASYGVPRPPERLVHTPDEAVAAAQAIGYPVALKAQSPKLLHKTEAGAIALSLATDEMMHAAWADMAPRIAGTPELRGMLVQKMAPPGVEVIVGVARDEQFGPMILCGLGGILVEALDDVVMAPVPVTRERALELIASLRGARILGGVRGRPPADTGALADLIAAVSRFAAEHADRIAEVDLNPVIVHAHGLSVVDALIIPRG